LNADLALKWKLDFTGVCNIFTFDKTQKLHHRRLLFDAPFFFSIKITLKIQVLQTPLKTETTEIFVLVNIYLFLLFFFK
jgi:hypothetical protein